MTGYRNKRFVTAEDVANDFGCSRGKAYELIHILNKELKAKGYLTVSGKVSAKYYCERVYAYAEPETSFGK